MKKLFLFIGLIVTVAAIAYTDPGNIFRLGNGAAVNKRIIFNRGGSNPELRWNESLSTIQYSNDGSAFSAFTGEDASALLTNLGLAASISSNTLVVSLKDKAGSDPAASSAVKIGVRSATLTTGTYSVDSVVAAKSITLAANDTIGLTNSIGTSTTVGAPVYVYWISDTTSEMCLAKTIYDEGSLRSATALTGGADTLAVLYCTNAHTSRPIRLLGAVYASWSNPNWSAITQVSIVPLVRGQGTARFFSGYHDNTCSWSRTSTTIGDPTADSTCGFSTLRNNEFGTVTTYLSGSDSLPGIVWTTSAQANTGYFVCAQFTLASPTSATDIQYAQLTDSASQIIGSNFQRQYLSGAGVNPPWLLCGIVTGGSASSTQSVRIQIASSANAATLQNVTPGPPARAAAVEWYIYEIH